MNEIKTPSNFLVKTCQLIDLLDEEDQFWWEERVLNQKKKDLKNRILAKIIEIQNT